MAKSLVNEKALRAAYQLLKVTTFKDVKLPTASRVTFRAAKLKKYHALYELLYRRRENDNAIMRRADC